MGELGLLGMMIEERFGGGGLDALTYVLAVEEISRACASLGVTMSVTNSVCGWPISRFGTETLKARALPELAFFRGRVVPYADVRLGLLTHALNYGTAVFGGLRAFWNDDEKELFVFRPLDHFRRFVDSARLLRMELPHSPEDLWTGLRELLRKQNTRTDCYIRALAFYGDETLGVRLHELEFHAPVLELSPQLLDGPGSGHIHIGGGGEVPDRVAYGRLLFAHAVQEGGAASSASSGGKEIIILK